MGTNNRQSGHRCLFSEQQFPGGKWIWHLWIHRIGRRARTTHFPDSDSTVEENQCFNCTTPNGIDVLGQFIKLSLSQSATWKGLTLLNIRSSPALMEDVTTGPISKWAARDHGINSGRSPGSYTHAAGARPRRDSDTIALPRGGANQSRIAGHNSWFAGSPTLLFLDPQARLLRATRGHGVPKRCKSKKTPQQPQTCCASKYLTP